MNFNFLHLYFQFRNRGRRRVGGQRRRNPQGQVDAHQRRKLPGGGQVRQRGSAKMPVQIESAANLRRQQGTKNQDVSIVFNTSTLF